jgi:hypothetical protein
MSWIEITPTGLPKKLCQRYVVGFVRELHLNRGEADIPDEAEIESIRRRHIRHPSDLSQHDQAALTAAINVLTDLVKQGWKLRVKGKAIEGSEADPVQEDSERARRREQFSARRNEQLRESATREFIQKMESGHLFRDQRISIFCLMRDGRDLAQALEQANHRTIDEAITVNLIKPYLEFVERDKLCAHTGFSLQDIWRYFRHTWSNPYESIPGRTLLILVRDAAAPFHPVIGIAALSSAAATLPARDEGFIRWDSNVFLEDCIASPTSKIADWVLDYVTRATIEIYKLDFIRQDLIPAMSRSQVSEDVIDELRRVGREAKDSHHRQMEATDYKGTKSSGSADENWERQAQTQLFRCKRAIELASLFEIRNVITRAYRGKTGKARLVTLLSSSTGRDAFRKVVRMARSDMLGTAIADLTVCGAVAPYNEILGGKLTAMLAVSPEVIDEYKKKYGNAASVIASSMAGRRVVRSANLVFVGTTSLYGVRPSQYDRINIPCEILGGDRGTSIRYKFLDQTGGWGTYQFGRATKESLEELVISQRNGRRVNNVFGEGANPKMRALREGLTLLGLSPEVLLKHGLKKCVYGVSLISNLKDYLLGISLRPKYLFPRDVGRKGTDIIAKWWFQRWVLPRLERADIIERLKQHTHVHPIRHGARVFLPDAHIEQRRLF